VLLWATERLGLITADANIIRDAAWTGRTINLIRDSSVATQAAFIVASHISSHGVLALQTALDVFKDDEVDAAQLDEYWLPAVDIDIQTSIAPTASATIQSTEALILATPLSPLPSPHPLPSLAPVLLLINADMAVEDVTDMSS
jgi:hypothetical protein